MKFEKHIKSSKLEYCSYPVGDNIVDAKRLASGMTDIIKEVWGENELINLWCSGSSGSILSALVAFATPIKRIIHVKKGGEISHSGNSSNTLYEGFKYDPSGENAILVKPEEQINIIVDDFISSGNTIKRILDNFKDRNRDLIMQGMIVGGSTVPNLMSDYFIHTIVTR